MSPAAAEVIRRQKAKGGRVASFLLSSVPQPLSFVPLIGKVLVEVKVWQIREDPLGLKVQRLGFIKPFLRALVLWISYLLMSDGPHLVMKLLLCLLRYG